MKNNNQNGDFQRLLNINEILKILNANQDSLKEKYAVEKIGIFGSYTRGEGKKTSDIDIYVEFKMDELTFDKYFSLTEFLEKTLGKKIDLITKDGKESIRIPEIRAGIEKEIIYV